MKKNRFLALLLSMMTLFTVSFLTSCEETEVDEGMASLKLSTSAMAFNADGTSADETNGELTITANRSWVVEVPAAIDWVIIEEDQLMGDGDATIQVSVPDNTGSARTATVSVKLYNDSGLLMEETFTVSQANAEGGTEVTSGTARFDGSELPTAYSDNEAITVDGVEFTINQVANFSSKYETQGPIQFGKAGSYIYNNVAFKDLKSVVINLAPKGTQYNNFQVFVGSEAGATTTEIEVSKSGDVATYTVPEGTTFVSIRNDANYTAYAFNIEFLCGDDESTVGGGSTGGDNPGGDVTGTASTARFDGSELPTTYPDSEDLTVDGSVFVINKVANFSSQYETQGPIQFQKGGSYIYNKAAFKDLKSVVIKLAPEGTEYNNFKVFAGSEAGAKTTEIEVSKDGDILTYAVPAGTTFVSVCNDSGYAAFAFNIEFLCGTDESNIGGGSTGGGDVTGTASTARFDGSELPTAYSDNADLTVDGTVFTINQVANFTSQYESQGPIQFGKAGSYIYNEAAFKDLKSVVIKLAPEGTKYNNFKVFAGSEAGAKTTEIEVSKDGDILTYAVPNGTTFVSVRNDSDYTAYAFNIEFLCGTDESNIGGGSTGGENPGGGDDNTGDDIPTYELTGTINATDFISENAAEVPDAIFGVYKFVWSKGTHASLAPKYYTSGDAIRMYGGNTMTVSTTDGSNITSIDFKFDEGAEYLSADAGSFDAETGAWSGSATSVTFTSSTTSARIMSITMNGFKGEGETTDPEGDSSYTVGDLSINGSSNKDFPTEASESDAVVVTEKASFVLNNTLINSYKSVASYSNGYFYNLTAFEGLTKIVVTEDYKYYNYTLYAGTEVHPTTNEVKYTKEGDYYTYEIPAGCKYITFANNSEHSASGDVIDFYFDSLGATADFEGGSTEEPDVPSGDDVDALLEGQVNVLDLTADDFGYQYNSSSITVSDVTFTYNNVGYYTKGQIQMNSSKPSSLYNTTAITSASSVVINLTADKKDNAFNVYAGKAENPTEGAITPTVVGNTCVYSIPAGSEFIMIESDGGAAYADLIKFYKTK